ncbi:MAG: hypothetical protein FWE82_02545 [Defluviitaleaceae bacterium]|nr:hypothetical protein [Defluviitaleaceae bacterium]
MPRPMLKTQQTAQQQENILSTTAKPQTKNETETNEESMMKLDRLLRRPRSKAYMEAMTKLDAGGKANNREKVQELINIIRSEFPEVELAGYLLGYVSKCYLGNPYEVHILDANGEIVEHYQKGKPLPGGLEKARSIAIRGGYDFIEVYSDCCRAVSSNGSVSVIK